MEPGTDTITKEPYTVSIIKINRLRQVGHLERKREAGPIIQIFNQTLEGSRPEEDYEVHSRIKWKKTTYKELKSQSKEQG